MQRLNRFAQWTAVFLAAVWVSTVLAATPARLATFDAYAERVLREFDVPGMAVAVVQDGAVVFARGYGIREMGKPEFVDEHTLFAIASNTKAFTSTLLAQLVDEKKLHWDDRVIDHLPWFAMSDPYVTREMTIRDLLVHRSGLGLGAGDLLFWPTTNYTTKEVVQRLKFIPLATSFRAAYAYDNILYAVAGLVIEEVSGRTWAQNIRERIFAPVGMTNAKPNCLELAPNDNTATGHAKLDFKDLRPVPPLAWDNNSAAGGIYANVTDLARWMQVQLDAGRLPPAEDGAERRLFAAARQKDMWTLVTPMPFSNPPPLLAEAKRNFRGYALGWEITDFRGQRLVTHTGGWPGQVSRTTLVPDRQLGIVVLTNQEVGAAFQAVTMHLLDVFFDAPEKDWCAAYAEIVRKSGADADDSWAKLLAGRAADSQP